MPAAALTIVFFVRLLLSRCVSVNLCSRMVTWVRTLATYFETAPMDLAVIHSFWDVYLYD